MFKWSETDVKVIPLMLFIFIAIAIGLHFLLRNKKPSIKRMPLQVVTVIVVAIEIAKQIYYIGNTDFTYYVLPLHFCSLFMVLMPLSQFCGRRVGSIFKPMTFVYSCMVLLLVLANPNALIGQSTADILGSFHNIHTFVFHFAVIAYFIFSIALEDYQPKIMHCINIACGIAIYASYAIPCSYHLNANYVNILYSMFKPLEDFRLWAGQVWYNIVLFLIGILGACLILISYYIIYNLISSAKAKKQKKAEMSNADNENKKAQP